MKQQPAQLEYSFLPVTIGQMLIARSSLGLSAIMLGDNEHTLTQSLKARFPTMHPKFIADGLNTEKMLVKSIMYGEATVDDASLDFQGTAFQMTVWRALMDIPYASTVSYQQLAEATGRPSATRAVASACGANPLAIVMPCHRVIRKDGGPGGYHWGLNIKRELLALEQQIKQRRQKISAAATVRHECNGADNVMRQ